MNTRTAGSNSGWHRRDVVIVMNKLLDEVEAGALESSVPLADVLRKCVSLGGWSGSESIRDWALQELNG